MQEAMIGWVITSILINGQFSIVFFPKKIAAIRPG
jgi:hypothetical protein